MRYIDKFYCCGILRLAVVVDALNVVEELLVLRSCIVGATPTETTAFFMKSSKLSSAFFRGELVSSFFMR